MLVRPDGRSIYDSGVSESLKLTDAYRSARRALSSVCGVAIAWAMAQFDIKTASIGFIGTVDISGASIPITLACAILFLTLRWGNEYAMMPLPVRRWKHAQFDFRLTSAVVGIAFMLLPAASVSRSPRILLFVGAIVIMVILSFIAVIFGSFLLVKIPMDFVFDKFFKWSWGDKRRVKWDDRMRYLSNVVGAIAIVGGDGWGINMIMHSPDMRALFSIPAHTGILGISLVASAAVVATVSAIMYAAAARKLFSNLERDPYLTFHRRYHWDMPPKSDIVIVTRPDLPDLPE